MPVTPALGVTPQHPSGPGLQDYPQLQSDIPRGRKGEHESTVGRGLFCRGLRREVPWMLWSPRDGRRGRGREMNP